MESNCRIGRITYKNTDRTLSVVPKIERVKVAQDLLTKTLYILDNYENPRAYALIVLDEDGAYCTAVEAENFPFGYATFISLIKSLFERDVITNSEVRYFCEQQGWIK